VDNGNDAMRENVTREKGAEGAILLTALLPAPRNARRHSARNLALIEQSLREVGAARVRVTGAA
jgi:hypothetical protein